MPSAAHVDHLAGLVILRFFRMACLMAKCIVLDFLSAALQIIHTESLVDRVVIHCVTDRKDSRFDLVRNDLIAAGCYKITEIGDEKRLSGGFILLLISGHPGIDDITGIYVDDRILLEIRVLEDRELLRVFLISKTARRDDIELLLFAVIPIDQKNCYIVEMDGMDSCRVCTLPVPAVEAEAWSLVGLLSHGKFHLEVLLFRSDCDSVDCIRVIILAIDLCTTGERSFDITACVK